MLLLAALLIMAFTLAACDSVNPPAENTSPPPTATPDTPSTTTPDTTPPETTQPTDNGNGEETANGGDEIDYDNLPPIIPAPPRPEYSDSDFDWLFLDFSHQGVTNERLAEMVSSGEIPAHTTGISFLGNQISDLTPLSQLANLWIVSIPENQVSDLTPLMGLQYLRQLDVRGNQISDITPLSGLTDLQILNLSDNDIRDITPISGLTNLTKLEIDDNHITSIAALRGMTNLETLNIRNNQFYNLTPLRNLTSLTNLTIGTLKQISGSNATEADLDDIDLTPLHGLSNLESLSIHYVIRKADLDALQHALPNTNIINPWPNF